MIYTHTHTHTHTKKKKKKKKKKNLNPREMAERGATGSGIRSLVGLESTGEPVGVNIQVNMHAFFPSIDENQ